MERFVYEELIKWKNRKYRKPLIVDGEVLSIEVSSIDEIIDAPS